MFVDSCQCVISCFDFDLYEISVAKELGLCACVCLCGLVFYFFWGVGVGDECNIDRQNISVVHMQKVVLVSDHCASCLLEHSFAMQRVNQTMGTLCLKIVHYV